MNHRLETCLAYAKGFDILIDVGTDHAYLPVEAIKRHIVKKAYAVDNKQGPLNTAKHHIQVSGLSSDITLLLSNGIEALPEDADVLVMAGLGGHAIYTALKSHPLKALKRLILQPNNHPEHVRRLTESQPLKIVEETVVFEQGIYYPIIVFEIGHAPLSEQARLFGPVLLKKRPDHFIAMLKEEAHYLNTLIKQIPEAVAQKKHIKRLTAIEEVIYARHSD